MNERIVGSIRDSIAVQTSLLDEVEKIGRSVNMIMEALRRGSKILAAGNGGSAADAQHFVGELVATYKTMRRGWPAICLNDNTSIITAWSNDFGFDTLFARQIEAFGIPGDIFIPLSTGGGSFEPGPSVNIALAARKAKEMGLGVIGFSGKDGGVLKKIADPCFVIKSRTTARIQEAHMSLLHVIVEEVDELMFGEEAKS